MGVHVKLSYVAVSGVEGSEEERDKVKGEIRRAIGGRLEGWNGLIGEEVDVPEVGLASEEFEHARNVVARQYGVKEEEVVSCQECESLLFTTLSRFARADGIVEICSTLLDRRSGNGGCNEWYQTRCFSKTQSWRTTRNEIKVRFCLRAASSKLSD